MAEEEGAPVEAPAEPAPPAPEEAAAAEPPPPAAEPPPPAAEPPPPAAEEPATPTTEPSTPATPTTEPSTPASEATESVKPSKSTLAMEKRTSTMSRVRLQEPGDVAPEGEKEIKPEGEKRKSEERRKSEGRTSQQRGSAKGSLRGSAAGEEGILRRKSDRPSKSKLAVGSVVSIRRTSAYGVDGTGAKIPKFMNSYKLDSDNPFQPEKVEKIMKEILTEALDDLTYDPDKCPKQAKWASSAIRSRVKEQDFDRYKIVVLVTIGEKRYHDMCCMVRFLWDIERDKYALFVHENMYVFATALCFGVYFE